MRGMQFLYNITRPLRDHCLCVAFRVLVDVGNVCLQAAADGRPWDVQYGLPPMCVEGQTPDSAQHVKAAFAHLKKVAEERKMFQLNVNSSSALAQRWKKRMGE